MEGLQLHLVAGTTQRSGKVGRREARLGTAANPETSSNLCINVVVKACLCLTYQLRRSFVGMDRHGHQVMYRSRPLEECDLMTELKHTKHRRVHSTARTLASLKETNSRSNLSSRDAMTFTPSMPVTIPCKRCSRMR
jgi:hypothetical protein